MLRESSKRKINSVDQKKVDKIPPPPRENPRSASGPYQGFFTFLLQKILTCVWRLLAFVGLLNSVLMNDWDTISPVRRAMMTLITDQNAKVF